MKLEELRHNISQEQKKGLPFIYASLVVWLLITVVTSLDLPIYLENILVFSCSIPMLPISWFVGKKLAVNIFDKKNPLSELGFLFTCNQLLYLLIVMWVFNASPNKMVMVYAMVFGAHLLPYSWLYKSNAYKIMSIIITFVSLIVGSLLSAVFVASTMSVMELLFLLLLHLELKRVSKIEDI